MSGQPGLFTAPQVALTNDDWYTPKWIFETLDVEFDMDVSGPPGGVPWIPAKRVLTKAEDGLITPWEGRVWMNPPFSKTKPWAMKFMSHRQGIALLPMGRNHWNFQLWNSDAHMVQLPADLKFMKNGKPTGMMMSALLVTYEDELIERLARIGRVR